MDQDIRFCTTADNVKLAYAVCGSGPPLVMSATWLTHLEHQWKSLAWRPWLEAFVQKHRLLRYDSRGCGLSDRDTKNLSFENWILDFERVIDAASFERFPIIGTCQGGPIAIEYAARHPERVSHLILFGTYARGRMQRTGLPGQLEKASLLSELTQFGWGQENHAFLQVWASLFQPGGNIEHLRSWCDQMRAATTAEMAVQLLQIGWNVDVSDVASRVKCPVLVIHAERDVAVPIAEGRLLASLLPNCRFVQIDSQNHMPLADEPAWSKVLQLIDEFLAEEGPDTAKDVTELPLHELTPRELTVLDGIAQGLDNSGIAAALAISEKTVRNHITRIFSKINVEHRYQAIVLARDSGLGAKARLSNTN